MAAEPSKAAQEAITDARHARASSEAVLPLAEHVRDKVREAVRANHFTALMVRTLTDAATAGEADDDEGEGEPP